MKNDPSSIKTIQLFESYSQFYQPYIAPVLRKLKRDKNFIVNIWSYKKNKEDNESLIVPTYRKRKIYEKFYQFTHSNYKDLNYLSIKSLTDEVDIIHLQHSFLFTKIIPLINYSTTTKPKIVITLRGGDTYVKPWVNNKWKSFYQTYGNAIDMFIVMSKHQKKYLQRWGVDEKRIAVIPISFGETQHRLPRSIKDKAHIKLVSVFRLCWEKNIEGNLKFIQALKGNGINVSYDIYGDGPEKGKLLYLIDKLSLKDSVNFKGRVNNSKLKDLLPTYDFILQLSHSESLGMSIIEAQSFGVPAIVSNNGGLPEIVSHLKNGIVVKENIGQAIDNILNVIQDEVKYLELSKSAILNANTNFSVSNEVASLSELYKSLIKKS